MGILVRSPRKIRFERNNQPQAKLVMGKITHLKHLSKIKGRLKNPIFLTIRKNCKIDPGGRRGQKKKNLREKCSTQNKTESRSNCRQLKSLIKN